MALLQNITLNTQYPYRRSGATSANTETGSMLSQMGPGHGREFTRFIGGLPTVSALPSGYNPGILMPLVHEEISSWREAEISVVSSANGLMGLPTSGTTAVSIISSADILPEDDTSPLRTASATLAISAVNSAILPEDTTSPLRTATTSLSVYTNTVSADLITSASGESLVSISTNSPMLTASIEGSGSASITTAGNALLGATVDAAGVSQISINSLSSILPLDDSPPARTASSIITLSCEATALPEDDTPPARTATAQLSLNGTMEPYAVGNLQGFAKLAGDQVVEVEYGGTIYLADWGSDGSEYPAGSATYPVRTLEAAIRLCSRYSIKHIYFKGSYVLNSSLQDFIITGWGPLQFCQIDLNNQELDRLLFQQCILTGELNAVVLGGEGWQSTLAKVEFDRCFLFEVTGLQGTARNCQVEGLTTVYAGGWFSSTDTVIEGDNTVFDLQNASGTAVSMDVNSGWSQFINAVDGCLIELNVKGGEVSFDSSCTGGEYYLEGVGTLYNDSAMTKKENHFIWDEQATVVNSVGSTGNKLNTASAGGVDLDSMAEAVWSYER